MNQKVRESLSAVMDGEGDELELRRVLRALAKTPEEGDAWRRYHVARSVMRRERDIDVTVDLSAAIRARIDAQQPPAAVREGREEGTVRRHGSGPFSFMGGAAVAAAVSLMVITGVQVYRGVGQAPADTPSFASNEENAQSGSTFGGFPGAGQLQGGATPVGFAGFQPRDGVVPVGARSGGLFPVFDGEEQGIDTQQQARLLQGFFDQHAQQADFQPQGQWSPSARFLGPVEGMSSAP